MVSIHQQLLRTFFVLFYSLYCINKHFESNTTSEWLNDIRFNQLEVALLSKLHDLAEKDKECS